MRVGQKNGLVRQWAPKGSRPRQTKDLRTESAYLFGAICPERGEGAALVLPRANTEAMDLTTFKTRNLRIKVASASSPPPSWATVNLPVKLLGIFISQGPHTSIRYLSP